MKGMSPLEPGQNCSLQKRSATSWFDQAFTENVLETLAFEYGDTPLKDTKENSSKLPAAGNFYSAGEKIVGKDGSYLKEGKWYCIEGGTEELTKTLERQFEDKISRGKRVVKMALSRKMPEAQHTMVIDAIDTNTGRLEVSRHYSAIINTTTLAALQKVDLTEMELTYGLKAAIRSLRYDTSTKVAIQFEYPWWITKRQIKRGGLGKTDMPLRTWCVNYPCEDMPKKSSVLTLLSSVYPSYSLHDDDKKPAVLLCSYTVICPLMLFRSSMLTWFSGDKIRKE